MKSIHCVLALTAATVAAAPARADFLDVSVTVRNLAPAGSVSFAPLRLGFHRGTYDAFNIGQPATAPIISVAEGGSGADWFPAFAAADPTATLGSVGGALLPGATATNTFRVDPFANPYFTFASMVIPSNDLFIGNDSPVQFRLFDGAGRLTRTAIGQRAGDIWDAGSEAADPAHAAFVVGGVNDLRTPQNGVVTFSRGELAAFNGLTTGGGYVYDDSLLADDTPVYEIAFEATPVPAPPGVVLGLLAVAGFAVRRRLATPPGQLA